MLENDLSRSTPALLTRTSILPNSESVCSTILATPLSSVTDAPLEMALPPLSMMVLTTASAASDDPPDPSTEPPRSLTTTFAPLRANSKA